jgi:hypothetical protein
MSEEEANAREEHRAEMFRRAANADLVTKILGPQKDADSVGDGIPMALESVIKLFRLMGIGKNDLVLEAGYGHYPRLAILAAFVTQRPTIAFEPFAYEHFKNVMNIRFKDKEGVLTWKYPEAAEKVKLSAQQKRKRKAAEQQNRSADANGIEDGETPEDEGNHESNEDGDGSNKRNKNRRGDDATSKRKTHRSLAKNGKKSKKTTASKVMATAAKKSKKKKSKSKKSKKVKGGENNGKKRKRDEGS